MEQLEIDWDSHLEFDLINVLFDYDNLAVYNGAYIFLGPRYERYELIQRTGRYSYIVKRKP